MMPCRIDRAGFAVLVAAVIGVAALTAAATATSPPQPALIYQEPDDPILGILGRASRRINSDNPKDYTEEALHPYVARLDEAIATRPLDPRPHWWRSRVLKRMKRTPLARAAREEAIKLARGFPAGDELIGQYYGGHAEACVEEGDRAAGAASFLAMLDLRPDTSVYNRAVISVAYLERDPKAPGPGPLFPTLIASKLSGDRSTDFSRNTAVRPMPANLTKWRKRSASGWTIARSQGRWDFPDST